MKTEFKYLFFTKKQFAPTQKNQFKEKHHLLYLTDTSYASSTELLLGLLEIFPPKNCFTFNVYLLTFVLLVTPWSFLILIRQFTSYFLLSIPYPWHKHIFYFSLHLQCKICWWRRNLSNSYFCLCYLP